MPTPIETALSTLLPTVHSLPPELISLSTSLLAQSRAKAASLKPEEEIGRTYACCHIACQRLGHKLALEIAKPAPPVQPRVYNKLHTYFNTVLTTPKTPRKVDKLAINGSGQASRGQDGSRKTPARQPATPTSNGKRKAEVLLEEDLPEMPNFVASMIRAMAEKYSTAGTAPHVFAGVESVFPAHSTSELASKKRRISSRIVDSGLKVESLPAIICIMMPAVAEKMCGPDVNRPTLTEDIIEYAHLFLSQNTDKIPFFLPTEAEIANEVAQLQKERADEWMKMEWYQNVPLLNGSAPGAQQENTQTHPNNGVTVKSTQKKTPLRRAEKHGKRAVDGVEDLGAAGLLPGLGTMFQPALDWLSDERRADFVEWREAILREASQMEMQKA